MRKQINSPLDFGELDSTELAEVSRVAASRGTTPIHPQKPHLLFRNSSKISRQYLAR